MPVYLYCLLPAVSDPPPAGLRGHTGARVRALPVGELVAWVSELPDGHEIERSAEAARLHDAVCAGALGVGVTPIPARFGQRFETDAACAADVRSREAGLVAALRRVAGGVEMTVHLPLPAARGSGAAPGAADAGESASEPGPGRRHLQRLRGALEAERIVQQRARAAAEQLRSALGPLVRDEQVRAGGAGTDATVAHLVSIESLDAYRTALELFRSARGGAVRWSGPYVPYSFTGERTSGRPRHE